MLTKNQFKSNCIRVGFFFDHGSENDIVRFTITKTAHDNYF